MKRCAIAGWVLGVALVGFGACSAPNERWLQSVEAAQRAADAALVAGELSEARAHLSLIAEGDGVEDADAVGVRALRQDAFYQLARLAFAQEDGEVALRCANAGLALGEGGDLYEANLWIARGQAHELLGDPERAAEDYHRALVLNDALLDVMLRDAP